MKSNDDCQTVLISYEKVKSYIYFNMCLLFLYFVIKSETI